MKSLQHASETFKYYLAHYFLSGPSPIIVCACHWENMQNMQDRENMQNVHNLQNMHNMPNMKTSKRCRSCKMCNKYKICRIFKTKSTKPNQQDLTKPSLPNQTSQIEPNKQRLISLYMCPVHATVGFAMSKVIV